jgi:hypothetical protein
MIRMEMKYTLKTQQDIGTKREYDSNGTNENLIYLENSVGYYEYDSNGNEIYFENSKGDITDNRSTCEGKIVEIEGKKYKLTSL